MEFVQHINYALAKSDIVAKEDGTFTERPAGPRKPRRVREKEAQQKAQFLQLQQQYLALKVFHLFMITCFSPASCCGIMPVVPFTYVHFVVLQYTRICRYMYSYRSCVRVYGCSLTCTPNRRSDSDGSHSKSNSVMRVFVCVMFVQGPGGLPPQATGSTDPAALVAAAQARQQQQQQQSAADSSASGGSQGSVSSDFHCFMCSSSFL